MPLQATEGVGQEGAALPEAVAAEQTTEELVTDTSTPALPEAVASSGEPSLASPPPPDPSDHPPRKGEGIADAEPVIDTPAETGDTPVAEEPKPILLWRQARFERHGPAHRRPDHRRHGGQRQVAANAQDGSAPAGERPAQEGRQQPGERPPYQGRRDGGEGAGRPEGKPKFNRDRYKGPPKPPGEGARPDFRQGKPQGEGGRPDRQEGRGQDGKPTADRSRRSSPGSARSARSQVDPLSPFAKLAALRDQLQPKK